VADQPPQEKIFGKYQEIVLLLLGFLLTSVVGAAVGAWFQERSWTHEHLVQMCDSESDTRSKGLASLSDLMDKRLLRMRQLAYKLETARSVEDVQEERRNNKEMRDEWSTRLNSNLSFTQTYFGDQARNTLEHDIATEGFGKIHNEFNDFFTNAKKTGRLDKAVIAKIASDIEALNPAVYTFDLNMQEIITDRAGKCATIP
jgi:hypothetical protein